jgi:hypothetical protein
VLGALYGVGTNVTVTGAAHKAPAAPPHRRTAAPPHRRTAAPPHRRTAALMGW